MSEWMPIETAPKDGTHVLAQDAAGQMYVIFWYLFKGNGWYVDCGDPEQWYGESPLTYWQHLPEPRMP